VTPSSDTIAAISTAPGEGAIAVVRVSGPESLAIADRVFRGSGPPPSQRAGNSFVHGFVRSAGATAGGEVVDEVVLLIFRAPHSYTREDVVEFQGHGGRASAARILRTVLEAGARSAEAGEFTLRAFLNGRIDLVQAEAVADLVAARTERAAAAAVEQLEGRLSRVLGEIHDGLMDCAAHLDASLDFDEEEIGATLTRETEERLKQVRGRLADVLGTWNEGRLLREGAVVAIAGRPNVGKSTLLNQLVGRNRAIVTSTPGTTRDTIEEEIVIEGIPIRIVDTAGLRDGVCEVEKEGVRRAKDVAMSSQRVLYVIDASVPLCGEDASNLAGLGAERCVVVLNKTDISGIVTDLAGVPQSSRRVPCSALTGEGLPEVRRAICAALGVTPPSLPHAVISERHRFYVQNALNEVDEALTVLPFDRCPEIATVASCLRTAIENLGMITGRSYSDEILSTIFSKFCIGK
jgi:tRNA modification GTPase